MKKSTRLGVIGCALLAAFAGYGELQRVEVGGEIVVLGEYYTHLDPVGEGLRWGQPWVFGRPTGGALFSAFGWDDDGGDVATVSQWTRLHVRASFTDAVSAFIEFDSLEVWGEDFRSQDYLTGRDSRADSSDDIHVYQAHIDVEDLFGAPLRLRLGRQELSFGGEWLVGPNTDGPAAPDWGLSFDAIRVTWQPEPVTLDVFWAKVAEGFGDFGDDDIDFYGVYASCAVLENAVVDAYWFWLRDTAAVPGPEEDHIVAWLGDISGASNYDDTDLHTVGLRFAGEFGAFDFESEVAYQFGDASRVGALQAGLYFGDDGADFGEWAANLELGYTVDVAWGPRAYVAYAYFGGEDHRDISFGQWLAALFNPYYCADASVSFNRLFSDWCYSAIMDATDFSNVHVFRAGLSAMPTENIEVGLNLAYHLADEPFRRPVVPLLSFWTRENARELGFETDLWLSYSYTDDLYFTVGWDHLFVGEGLEEGSFSSSNGLEFNGGSDNDDADYFYFETGISF